MFDKPYPFEKAGKHSTLLGDPVEKVMYRFKAAKRKYLVILEIFSTGMAAIKFCDIKQRKNPKCFNHIYNDGDAIRVISTCLHIMHDYWRRNPAASFCFYAIPRVVTADPLAHKHLDATAAAQYLARYQNVRYAIYKYAMINLFSFDYFQQMRDSKNSLYILLNHLQKDKKKTMERLTHYLWNNYEMIFEEDIE